MPNVSGKLSTTVLFKRGGKVAGLEVGFKKELIVKLSSLLLIFETIL